MIGIQYRWVHASRDFEWYECHSVFTYMFETYDKVAITDGTTGLVGLVPAA